MTRFLVQSRLEPEVIEERRLICGDAYEQTPQSTRRNTLPVKLRDGPFLMRHKHLPCALVELLQIAKTPSGADGVLHHPPEAFDGVEVMAAVGRQEMEA